MKLAGAAALIVLVAVPAVAARRPITHQDLWLMRRVEAPALSPDGKWIVVPVAEPSYDSAAQVSDLWLIRADGSAPARRITHTKGSESGVDWSPDSRRIAFSTRRDGDEANQIYVLDLASGGEAQRITEVSTGAFAPKFSPDGSMLLFQSNVFPGAETDEANRRAATEVKARKHRARVYDAFPIRYWDKWLDETRRSVFVMALAAGSAPRDLLAGSQLSKEPGFGGAASLSGQDLQATWTPDSKSVVFTAATNRHEAAWNSVRTDLYRTSVQGGEPVRITRAPSSYSKPVFRPDGKALYAVEEQIGTTYSLDRLVMFSWPDPARPALITRDFDRSAASVAFTADNRHILLTAEDAGREKIYSVPADGGNVRLIRELPAGCITNLSAAGVAGRTVVAGNFDSASSPPEVVSIDPQTGEYRAISNFNAQRVAELDLPPLREFRITSSQGREIHSFVALPPDFSESRKYPLFVVMHGGPHSSWRDQWVTRWNYHLLAQPGYVVLLTNYTGSTGYGEKFAQRIAGDPLAGPAKEINEAADAAIQRFSFIDGSRQAAGGASYGGHLANWMQASTTRYKCLISHAGLINLESQWGTSDTIFHRELGMGGPHWAGGKIWQEQNPIKRAASFRTPILITVGENDFRVPLNQSLENWSVLQRMKVPSRLIVFPEENHWILKGENSRFFYSQVHEWLAKWLAPKS